MFPSLVPLLLFFHSDLSHAFPLYHRATSTFPQSNIATATFNRDIHKTKQSLNDKWRTKNRIFTHCHLSIQDNDEASNNENAETLPSDGISSLLTPDDLCDADQMSPTALAYVGDSVFELFVRCRYVFPSRRTSDLQNKVVGVVRAEAQSQMFSDLSSSLPLTKKEQQIMRRGRNSANKTGRGPAYQDATALEALIGYVYITDSTRCKEILTWIKTRLDEMDS